MPKKILVADDSPTVRNVAESLLRKHGYEVLLADDGTKALGMAKLDKPDLVFLDNSMPGLSGEEVCQEIKQSVVLKDVPVIMLLCKDEIKKKTELRLLGADAFIIKPFSPADLLDQVRDLLQTREAPSSDEAGKASLPSMVSSTKELSDKNVAVSDEKNIKKSVSPNKKRKEKEGLNIIETKDLMENFELSVPPADGAEVHGFEWFLSELQKETEPVEKIDSLSGEKPLFPKKKIPDLPGGSKDRADRKKGSEIYEINAPEKGYEDFVRELKRELEQPDQEKATGVRPKATEQISQSQLDQWFSDLKERISERIAQEVTKNINAEFLEKIIREEISKLAKPSPTPQEK